MKVLINMPHTSLKVPRRFYKGLLIKREEFRKYNLEMSDLNLDYLFKDYKYKKIKAKYSRMYCDIEKFKDERIEFMAQYGQGVIYTNTFDNKVFHFHDEKYKKRVYKYYDRYHKRLDRCALFYLKRDNLLLILDIHSFSDKMAITHHEGPFKDICIGIEKDFYNEEILNKIIEKIKSLGLTYEINYPYVGSIIPNVILKNKEKYKDKVVSIMLEINKRVYL